MQTVSIENAKIGFRNFSGKGGQYNREGDRNFVVWLDKQQADDISKMGLNVKVLPARDVDDEPSLFLKVAVGFKYPPKVGLIKKTHIEQLNESNISLLDWAEIESVDLIITTSEWSVSGNTGVKAWLKVMYVKLVEDEFESKYSDLLDGAQTCVGPNCPIE